MKQIIWWEIDMLFTAFENSLSMEQIFQFAIADLTCWLPQFEGRSIGKQLVNGLSYCLSSVLMYNIKE